MERYVCIHGHFYQPPRENPWLEAIEVQDSASPYHDWNERITAECYAPNGASRILDAEDYIVSIVNNYSRISFNFGPTLLSWLEPHAPRVYGAILEADRASRERFSGHGSALAQAYNHMILPLANRRDKLTQILWGLRDFEHRFGRAAEGMWLPETAVDLESLDLLAEHGIRFTILSPHQAHRVRPLGGRHHWREVGGAGIDPSMAYELRLPSGRKLSLFFYDAPISQAVAFERLLERGEQLAIRLLGALSEQRDWPQLVHIATDGETYGHHHRFGDMALAYALHTIELDQTVQITNYGEYLERHPPTQQVEILPNSSWSCSHGIERWRSDCGCSFGRVGWNQAWRAPLREALDSLRDRLAPLYEQQAGALLGDPWAARDQYIEVVLDRSRENLEGFLSRQAGRGLDHGETVRALKLLELQRHLLLMYTSCGWFFDELSGIETIQVIQYAGRAVQLAEELFGLPVEPQFLERLAQAKSNIAEHRDGALIYEKSVKPAMVDLEKVGAHYTVSSLFDGYGDESRIYCYTVTRQDYQLAESGRARLAIGRARFTSEITREAADLSFGVLHLGDHNLNCGVRAFQGDEPYQALIREAAEPFARADFAEIIRLFDKHFGESNYSLRSLFRDQQRTAVRQILESSLSEAESTYRQIYEHHAPLMRFIADLGMPLPGVFRQTAEFVLNSSLRRALREEIIDRDRVQTLLSRAQQERVELDHAGLGYALEQNLNRKMHQFREQPDDLALLEQLESLAAWTRSLRFEIKRLETQNIYYELWQRVYPMVRGRSDEAAQTWQRRFLSLGEQLSMRLENQ
jgi:alpha-amylase/alpha-mannosidase (GH57 family)